MEYYLLSCCLINQLFFALCFYILNSYKGGRRSRALDFIVSHPFGIHNSCKLLSKESFNKFDVLLAYKSNIAFLQYLSRRGSLILLVSSTTCSYIVYKTRPNNFYSSAFQSRVLFSHFLCVHGSI